MAGRQDREETAPAPPGRLADGRGLRVPGLLVVVATALTVRLWPLTRFAVWGSDTGEYRYLTARLVRTGSITFAYDGWGLAYPYFPGLYALAGTARTVLGVPLEAAVLGTGPVLGALAAGAVALLADNVAEDGRAGLAAGLVAATAMPLAFVTSHTMPGTYGHLLLAALLLVAVLAGTALRGVPGAGRRPAAAGPTLARWSLLALPPVLLLPATHHLSLYMLVGALVGGVLLREWGRDRTHRGRAAWEAGLVVASVALATAWWLGVATPFRERIVSDLLPGPPGLVVALSYLALLVPPALVVAVRRLRARRRGGLLARVAALRAGVRFPPAHHGLAAATAGFAALVVAGLVVLETGIPGTRIQVTGQGLVQVLPLLAFVALAVPGAAAAASFRGGEAVGGWTLAMLASLGGAILASSHVLLPYRHADYLVVVLAVLAGLGVVVLRGLPSPLPRLGWAALAVLVVLNGVAAYPPPAVMGGFQEGITDAEMAAVHWTGDHLPGDAVAAADHRLSSVLFGYAGVDATWDSAGPVLHAPNASAALEHRRLPTPTGVRNVTHVVVSPVMREHGVALYQWENARPLSEAAVEKFREPAFETLYDRRGVQVHRFNATGNAGP